MYTYAYDFITVVLYKSDRRNLSIYIYTYRLDFQSGNCWSVSIVVYMKKKEMFRGENKCDLMQFVICTFLIHDVFMCADLHAFLHVYRVFSIQYYRRCFNNMDVIDVYIKKMNKIK